MSPAGILGFEVCLVFKILNWDLFGSCDLIFGAFLCLFH